MKLNTLYRWDCLEIMKQIPDWSIDAIITDPPYWTTACKWDSVIPFEPMWEQLKRIIKPNWAIVLFGSEPFSSALRMSNIKMYKYDWIWEKERPTNVFWCKYSPWKVHEIISVFSKEKHIYIPEMVERDIKRNWINDKDYDLWRLNNNWSEHLNMKKYKYSETYDWRYRYPRSVIRINRETWRNIHPTQKPVALIEYLIKTYTNEWETVLDFTAGSWTTGVACINTNRNYILIEKDEWYCDIIEKRLATPKTFIEKSSE